MIIEPDRLTVQEVADFFDFIKQEDTSILTFQKADGNLVTAKDFFICHHHGKVCRYSKDEKKIAETHFLKIFDGNRWMLEQFKKEFDVIKELGDFDNWVNVTTHDYDGSTNDLNAMNASSDDTISLAQTGKTGVISGRVDASQYSKVKVENVLEKGDGKIMEYLDPNTREREQSVNIFDTVNTTRSKVNQNNVGFGKRNTKGSNITKSSNSSVDFREFMYVELPNLREKFLNKFNVLFHY